MIENNCNHKWEKVSDARLNENTGVIPSYFACRECGFRMTSPEIFQFEALQNQSETVQHLKGFQRYIAIIAVIMSFTALIISILK